MEIKRITPEQFVRKYEEKGSLNGTFADAQEYLRWVLSSRGTDNDKHFQEALKVFKERFNMLYFTTKYLRTLIDGEILNKNQRIRYILRQSGYGLVPTKRYYKELRCITRDIKNIIYQNKEGHLEFSDRVETISRLANVFVGEQLHKIVSKVEMDEIRRKADKEILKQEILAEINSRINFGLLVPFEDRTYNTKGMEVKWDKDFKCIDIKRVLPINEDIKISSKIESDYQIEKAQQRRQEKAINKLMMKQQNWINLNCAECKHLIKLPTFQDIETDKHSEFAAGIVGCVAKDIQDGIYLCCKCRQNPENIWKSALLKKFLMDIYNECPKETGVQFDAKDFSREYRRDEKEMLPGYLRRVINDFLVSLNYENKMRVIESQNLIKIQVVQKD